MAKTVNEAFTEFIRDVINLDPDTVAQAWQSRDNLLDNIKEFDGDDDFFSLYWDKRIQFGSCTKVINRFVKKLTGVREYHRSEVHKNGQAAVLNLVSKEWSFDTVPCFYTTTESNGRNYYLIPNGKGNWMKTDPVMDRDKVEAVRWGAKSLMLAHNHPSGDPTPSGGDIELTKRVCAAAKLFDINAIDHLVIATPRGMPVRLYVSLRKQISF